MKSLHPIIFLCVFLNSACNECRNDDCAPDDFISILLINEDETIYTYDLNFFYYDQENQKIEADIERALTQHTFHVFLDYQQEPKDHKYYLEVGGQLKTVEIRKVYVKSCCGDLLKFDAVMMDGVETKLPLRVELNTDSE